MSTLRQQYLSEWKSYPSTNEGQPCVLVRIVEINAMEGIVRVRWEDQLIPLANIDLWPLSTSWGKAWKELSIEELALVLRPGDWLAIKPEDSLKALHVTEMLLVAPNLTDSPPRGVKFHAHSFAMFCEDIRSYFLKNKFFPAQSNSLVPSPGLEVHLEPFITTWQMGSKKRTYYLPTSPELHLKRLLCRGYGPLFEIKTCFRNGENSNHHLPEFKMLEWYRPSSDLNKITSDIEDLLQWLAHKAWIDLAPPVEVLTMREVFQKFLNFDLTPLTDLADLKKLANERDIVFDAEATADDVFHLIFLTAIEPRLMEIGPLIIKNFPPRQAALARLTSDGWADRFEFYWNGLEIANAFHELNDPVEQKRRFTEEVNEKARLNKTPVPIDEEFLLELQKGMPPCAGIALGLERLYMAIMRVDDITELKESPFYFLS